MSVYLRSRTPADYPRIVAIQTQHGVPDPATVDDLERSDRIRPEDITVEELAAENEEGFMVGYGGLYGGSLNKAGHFDLYVRVDADWQGRGVGDLLYRELERRAVQHNAQVLDAAVREETPASLQWAQHRGFTVTQHLFESKLDLSRFDPSPFVAARTAAEAAGIRFVSIVDAMPDVDTAVTRFLDYMMILDEDIPGAAGQPRPPEWLVKQQIAEDPSMDPHGIILAVDGDRWAGVAMVQKQNNGDYYNALTGVTREYRGRHLATALKLVAIDYVRRKGALHIRTNNDSTNERMLAVNRKLGYESLPGVFRLERQLAQ